MIRTRFAQVKLYIMERKVPVTKGRGGGIDSLLKFELLHVPWGWKLGIFVPLCQTVLFVCVFVS